MFTRFNTVMPRTPLFDYDALLLSGKPIYLQNGTDYTVTTESAASAFRHAAKRRGISVAIRLIPEYDGLIIQGYTKGSARPVLPPPPVADFTKESYEFLFCKRYGCDNRLRPKDQIDGLCDAHRN